ncbi:hypothetical protein [Chryseobacterium sp. Mn2064]|uniref:hypothetical protein n=1 Tax=Chryseobacterium sp. Mn2064 TaxID=3395263 RepID=UPI003BEE98E2
MNFIKNGAGLKRKINVILTLQVSESDINTSEYKGFRILSCYDMLEKYDYRSSTDSNQKKLEYMLEEIIHSEYHILICNTHLDVVDFDTLSEMLMPHELIIDEILVPNESKRNKKLADGQEAYRNHSRWLHFYPGEIEDIYERFEAEIKSLKTRYKNTETKIQEV